MSYHSIIKMFKNQCDAGHPRLALHTLSEETNTIQSSVKETARNSENCTKKNTNGESNKDVTLLRS